MQFVYFCILKFFNFKLFFYDFLYFMLKILFLYSSYNRREKCLIFLVFLKVYLFFKNIKLLFLNLFYNYNILI
jgi:hypothetical protein